MIWNGRRRVLADDRRVYTATMLALAFWLTSCQGAQYTLPNVTDQEVAAAAAEIEAASPFRKVYRSDNQSIELIHTIGWKLEAAAVPICEQAGAKYCRYNYVYEKSDVANAFAYDQRNIALLSGMLQYLSSDDEVASILAHEIGHHIAGHNREGVANRAGGAAAGGVLLGVIAVLTGADQQSVSDAADMGMEYGAFLGEITYSREEEREADYLGAYLMARAGYDLEKGRMVWVRFAKERGSTQRSGFFDTHPSNAERVVAWRHTIDEIKTSNDLMPLLDN